MRSNGRVEFHRLAPRRCAISLLPFGSMCYFITNLSILCGSLTRISSYALQRSASHQGLVQYGHRRVPVSAASALLAQLAADGALFRDSKTFFCTRLHYFLFSHCSLFIICSKSKYIRIKNAISQSLSARILPIPQRAAMGND